MDDVVHRDQSTYSSSAILQQPAPQQRPFVKSNGSRACSPASRNASCLAAAWDQLKP
jgi:hypothetical protein